MAVESSLSRIVPEEHAPDISESSTSSPVKSPKAIWENLTLSDQIRWQYFKEKQHEWKNYTDDETQMIETAFQRGVTCVRLNAGNGEESAKGHLKELFIPDMIQYNPVSGHVRKIRRIGPDAIHQKISRWTRGYLESVSKDKLRHKSFIKYKNMMTDVVKEKKYKPPRSALCKRIVDSGLFIVLQMAAILLNTMIIGFDVEHNGPDASEETQAIFQGINHAFCGFFTAEIILRFGAMRKRKTVQKAITKTLCDRWFCFDLILVLLMVLETWVMPLFSGGVEGLSNVSSLRLMRLMRLSRVGRIGRLLQIFPEILMMLKSIAAAARAVVCTLFMLVVFLYCFGIVFKAQSEQSSLQQMFPTIPTTMWKLLIHGALMDELAYTVDTIGAEDSVLAALFMALVLLSNLIILNMLIGLICDVAKGISDKEKEMASSKALTADLSEFLEAFDMNSDQQISLEEFDLLVANPDVRHMLKGHQVDVQTLEALKVSLFSDLDVQTAAKFEQLQSEDMDNADEVEVHWKSLSFEDLIETILRFRGGPGKQATMLDVVSCERNLRSQIQRLEKLTAKNTITKAFGTSPLSTPKVSRKSPRVDEDHQADPMTESKSVLRVKGLKVFKKRVKSLKGLKVFKPVEGHHVDAVPEAKVTAMSDTETQDSGQAGIDPSFSAKEISISHSIQEERPVPESTSGEPRVVPATSMFSKVLEQQQDNLLTKMKEEFAQQQSTFKAFILEAIHDQMKSLVVAPREIVGQLARTNSISQNQVIEEKCPLSAEHTALFLEKIHEQMKDLEVGQREMLGQLARNSIPIRNQVTDSRCQPLAEQSQAAPQDAIAGQCDVTAGNRPPRRSDSNDFNELA